MFPPRSRLAPPLVPPPRPASFRPLRKNRRGRSAGRCGPRFRPSMRSPSRPRSARVRGRGPRSSRSAATIRMRQARFQSILCGEDEQVNPNCGNGTRRGQSARLGRGGCELCHSEFHSRGRHPTAGAILITYICKSSKRLRGPRPRSWSRPGTIPKYHTMRQVRSRSISKSSSA